MLGVAALVPVSAGAYARAVL
ncbi:hypothetical protein [Halobaculum litoreum]